MSALTGAVDRRDEEHHVAKGTDQLAALVQPILASGEELIGIARFSYNGRIQPNAITLDASITAIEHPGEPRVLDPDTLVFFPTANQLAIALTGGRLFVWSLAFTGKPKQFIGEVPLSAIDEVRPAVTTYGRQLRIVMRSKAAIDLEFLKGEPADEFTGQLQALVTTR